MVEPLNENLGAGVMGNTHKHKQAGLENIQSSTQGGVEPVSEQHEAMQVCLQDGCGEVTLGLTNTTGFVTPDLAMVNQDHKINLLPHVSPQGSDTHLSACSQLKKIKCEKRATVASSDGLMDIDKHHEVSLAEEMMDNMSYGGMEQQDHDGEMWIEAQGVSAKKKQMQPQATRHSLRLKNHGGGGGFSGRAGCKEKAKAES
jgi:hypothetical protein